MSSSLTDEDGSCVLTGWMNVKCVQKMVVHGRRSQLRIVYGVLIFVGGGYM